MTRTLIHSTIHTLLTSQKLKSPASNSKSKSVCFMIALPPQPENPSGFSFFRCSIHHIIYKADFPSYKPPFIGGFSSAMFDYQRQHDLPGGFVSHVPAQIVVRPRGKENTQILPTKDRDLTLFNMI